jgi:heme/copper-type cytochrome/quinol oxidase subunit 2
MSKLTSTAAKIVSPIALALAPAIAFAQTAPNALNSIKTQAAKTSLNAGLGDTNSGDLANTVGRLIGSALGLLGIILVVIIIYAGFLWMTAQGSEEKVKQAKTMIKNAIIGMILIFTAYAITNFVLSTVITGVVTP